MSYKKAEKKKFIKFLLCAVAILIAAVIVMPFFSKEEAYRMITVFEVSGTVGVVKDGIEYEAYPGMHLQEGHVIVTSEDSYARLVLDDDKYVKVEAGSRLEFETLGLLGTKKTRLKLDRGAITSEIVNPLGADEEYVVNTPNAVLAVRGTFFRVDLRVTKNGEIDTNVYTYGGKVASNRVMPTGEVVEEEVIVDAGFMTAIRMDALETIYIVGMAESPTGEPVEETKKNTVPIEPAVIPDDDLVDMYFASENGHEMFLSTDEIKENIEEREISIEEQAPVYDRANEVKEQEESNTENTTSTVLIPDDRGDWEEDTEVVVEEMDEPQQEVTENVIVEVEEEVVPEEVVQEIPEQVVVATPAPVVPPVAEEPNTEKHVHTELTTTTNATCDTEGKTVVSCSECGEIFSETILPKLEHNYVVTYTDGTATAEGSIREHCEFCDDTISEVELFSIPLHFPDEVFAQYIRDNYNNDSYTNSLSEEEFDSLASVTTIDVAGTASVDGGIESLVGLEYFPSLNSLNCDYNANLRSLNLDENTELSSLSVSGCTSLTSLMLYECKELLSLDCSNSGVTSLRLLYNDKLTELDASNCRSLTGITMYEGGADDTDRRLTTLDITGCTRLGSLNLERCAFLTDLDISTCTGLAYLDMTQSGITSIDVSNNSNLWHFKAYGATGLTSVDFSQTPNSQLSALYIQDSGVTDLNIEGCHNLNNSSLYLNDKLETINISRCPGITELSLSDFSSTLKSLNCSNTGISTLDTGLCSNLENLNVSNTDVSYLSTSNCSKLKELNCSGTNVSMIDVLHANNLTSLYVDNTPMTSLSLGGKSSLVNFSGAGSQISSLDITGTAITSFNAKEMTKLSSLTAKNSALTSLDVSGTMDYPNETLTTLDVSGSNNLTTLNVDYCDILATLAASNSGITAFSGRGTLGLTSMDVSDCNNLQRFELYNGYEITLNFTGCTNMETAHLENLYMSTLQVQELPALQDLEIKDCYSLQSLLIDDNLSLKNIMLQNTGMLETISAQRCTSLEQFNVSSCYALTSLDVTGCDNLALIDTGGRYELDDGMVRIIGKDRSTCTIN